MDAFQRWFFIGYIRWYLTVQQYRRKGRKGFNVPSRRWCSFGRDPLDEGILTRQVTVIRHEGKMIIQSLQSRDLSIRQLWGIRHPR